MMLSHRLLVTFLALLPFLMMSTPCDAKQIRGRRLLGACQGDCDVDADCDGDSLVCYHRNSGEDLPAVCGSAPGSPRTDVCIPVFLHPRPDVHDNPSLIIVNGVSPLQECWGDCDSDADCTSDLVCFQRNRGGDEVPGCRGFDLSRTDYCVRPDAETKPPVPNTFPNTFSYRYQMELTLGYSPSTAPRNPTGDEVAGAGQAVIDWVNDESDAAFSHSQASFKFEYTEITNVLGASQEKLTGILTAVFSATTENQLPNEVWYTMMLRDASGAGLLRNLKQASPSGSIYNEVVSESREFVPLQGRSTGGNRGGEIFDP